MCRYQNEILAKFQHNILSATCLVLALRYMTICAHTFRIQIPHTRTPIQTSQQWEKERDWVVENIFLNGIHRNIDNIKSRFISLFIFFLFTTIPLSECIRSWTRGIKEQYSRFSTFGMSEKCVCIMEAKQQITTHLKLAIFADGECEFRKTKR